MALTVSKEAQNNCIEVLSVSHLSFILNPLACGISDSPVEAIILKVKRKQRLVKQRSQKTHSWVKITDRQLCNSLEAGHTTNHDRRRFDFTSFWKIFGLKTMVTTSLRYFLLLTWFTSLTLAVHICKL